MAEINEIKLESPAMIEELLTNTLKEMGKIYEMGPDPTLKNGPANTFADGEDEQGLINTAEALECFFIPYFFIKGIREKFWNGELIDLEHISKNIKYLVKDYGDPDNIDGKLKLSGTPYMNFKFKGKSKDQPSGILRNMDFLDSACFILSALLDAKAINYEKKYLIEKGLIDKDAIDIISEDNMELVDNRIWEAAEVLKECDLGSGKGWAYTNDEFEPKSERLDQLYFTWNALETLELLRIYIKKAPHLIPPKILVDKYYSDLNGIFREKQSYLTSWFLSSERPSLNVSTKGEAIKFEGEAAGSYYYNLFAVISLLLSECKQYDELNLSLQTLISTITSNNFNNYNKLLKKQDHGNFDIAGSLKSKHEKEWSERAFICLFLKALSLYKNLDKGNFEKMVKGVELYKEKSDINLLQDCTNILIKEKLPNSNVWDAQKNKYTIYFTERAIEALVRVYEVTSGIEIKEYYKKQVSSVSKTEVGFSSLAPIIQIDLSQEIQNSIKNIIEAKVNDILSDGKITEKIIEQIKGQLSNMIEIDSAKMRREIVKFFNDASSNLANSRTGKKPDELNNDLAIHLTAMMGEIFINSFAKSLAVIAEKNKIGKVNLTNLITRLDSGFQYLANWEVKKGGTDFGKTLTNMVEKELIEFSTDTTFKKK